MPVLLIADGALWLGGRALQRDPEEREARPGRSTEVAASTKSARAVDTQRTHRRVSEDLKALLAQFEELEKATALDPSPKPKGLEEILQTLDAEELRELLEYMDFRRAELHTPGWRFRGALYHRWAMLDPQAAYQMVLKLKPGDGGHENDPFYIAYLAVFKGWADVDAAAAWEQWVQDGNQPPIEEIHMIVALGAIGPLVMGRYARQAPAQAWEATRASGRSNELLDAFFAGVPPGQDWTTYAAELDPQIAESQSRAVSQPRLETLDGISLAGRWAETDPEAAMAWAVKSDDGSFGGPDYVKGKVLQRWHAKEPLQAEGWMAQEAAAGRMGVIEAFGRDVIDSAGTQEAAKVVMRNLRDNEQRKEFLFWLAEWGPRITELNGTDMSQAELHKIVDFIDLNDESRTELRQAVDARFSAAGSTAPETR